MSNLVRDAWRKYLIQLQDHPLRTKAITAGVLSGFSDAIAQKISGVKQIQFRRLLLLMLFGFAYGGPFGHFFYKLMDAIFKGKKESTLTSPNLLKLKHKLGKDFGTVQLTAWQFWSIVGWVNYKYVPLQFRVLFGSFIGSCWSIFLNLKARSPVIKND